MSPMEMKGKCWRCQVDLAEDDMKKCSRCLLANYCSKDCQVAHWRTGHRTLCKKFTHSAVNPAGPSSEASDHRIDRELMKWIARYRHAFQKLTIFALDLANHSRRRGLTHCVSLVIQHEQGDSEYLRYKLVEASVRCCSDIASLYPGLEVIDDPNDLNRLRFVVTLVDDSGQPMRVYCMGFEDPRAAIMREVGGKAVSRKVAATWESLLRQILGDPSLSDS